MVKRKRRMFRRKRGPNIYKMNRQIKAIASRQELKHRDQEDITDNLADVATAWNVVCLNVLNAGDGHSNRDGDKVKFKRFFMRGYIDNNRGTAKDCICRIIIARCKYQEGLIQTESDILENPNSINSMRNLNKIKNWKTYFDQTFTMKAGSETGVQQFLPVKINIPLNFVTRYDGSAGTYADIMTNSLWIFLGSNVTTAAADEPRLTFDNRLTFYDS